jgi:thiamine pyrophosphate-dependent acetolactate synthase large subunit-like protein
VAEQAVEVAGLYLDDPSEVRAALEKATMYDGLALIDIALNRQELAGLPSLLLCVSKMLYAGIWSENSN